MTEWPKTYLPESAPPELIGLAKQLVPELLVGEHPTLSTLRKQYEEARIESVVLTGAGFYINYQVPAPMPCVSPAEFQGGSANICVSELQYGAGCVLFVRSGRIAFLEGYTFEEEWPERTEIIAVKEVRSLEIPNHVG